MESKESNDRSDLLPIRRRRPRLSRTRIVMGLLLIVAIAIFIRLADKAMHENAGAISEMMRRGFGR
jgi:hypothetical protein